LFPEKTMSAVRALDDDKVRPLVHGSW